jgi:C-terminal processing protease CtpA/Prc
MRSFSRVIVVLVSLLSAALAGKPGDRWRSRNLEIVNEVARLVQENYYDPQLKGIAWKSALQQARDRINNAENEGQMAAAIVGLLARLEDSHTYYLRPYRLEPVILGFRAKMFGDQARIYDIMPGGPAEQAGLKLGDRILGIQDFAVNRNIFDMEFRYFAFVDPVADLKLTVSRSGDPPKTYIVHGKQPATSSKDFVKLYEDYNRKEDKEEENIKAKLDADGVAYLRFPSFSISPSAANSMVGSVRGAKALVLDLRDNGGGYETTMKEMAGRFVAEPGLMVTGFSRRKREEIMVKPHDPLPIPLVVLIDSHSASASEVFARFMQLKKRAVVIGDRSAGKVHRANMFFGVGGIVYMIPFGVAITVSRAVMPDGVELEDHGVVPDQMCIPSEDDLRSGKDPCLEKAKALARDALMGAAVNSGK